ncbi:MAG TPA: glycosyltransferase family 39 protein, partial [Elusimicrobiota bacterium]|nr:glycosyltransferase family 39 protein [Elusimicrobiota bacterium]
MSERTWGFKSPLAHDFSPLKAWLPGLLFAAAALPFLNGLRGAFVYDDIPIIAQSPLVRGRAPLSAFFASSYWRHAAQAGVSARGGLYRPLTILSYALTWRLGTGAPWAFHAGNILLHALTTLVLFSLLKRLGSSRGASALGAAAFAVLPVHVEAVSWCVGRAELLAAFLMLAAWRLLHREERRGRLAAGLACYALALLSKESAAPLPAALILGELLGSGAPRELVRRRLPVWLAAFGVLLGYLSWRASVLGSALVVGAPYFGGRSRLVVLLTMAKFFVRGWLLPMATGLGLSPDYSRPDFPDAAPTDALAWACAAAAAALLALALRSFWRKRSPWAFAVLVFAALAAPLSNLLVPMEILGADRILYIPSLAFGALLAAGWDRLRSRRAAAPRMGAA